MSFGLRRLKYLRELNGLTQQQLSDASGVPVATIQKQEQGIQKDASLSIAIPLAKALGVPVEELFLTGITSKNVNRPISQEPADDSD